MVTTRTMLAACGALLLTVSIQAEQIEVPALPLDVPPPPAATADGKLTLDLAGAYELALSRNLNLQIGRYDIAAAGASIPGYAGVFDPNLSLGASWDYSKSPTASTLEGAAVTETHNTNLSLGLTQLLPTGTSLSVESGYRRIGTNSIFYTVNPAWYGDFSVRLTQPLLDGFGTLYNRSGIIIAENARDQTSAGFKVTVISTLREVENAYWDLIAAREEVKVKQQSLDLATRLLNETNERVKVGTSAPIDLVQSEAGVAARRQELIVAKNAAANAEDALKAVLGFDQPSEWMISIETTEGYQIDPQPADLEAAIRTALEQRPELEQQKLALSDSAFRLKLARHALMPDLDINAAYGFSGVGGTTRITDPSTGIITVDEGGIGDSISQITDLDFPHWTLGATFKVPFGNNQAKATAAQRRFEHQQNKVSMDALRQQIIREVRLAVRYLDDGAATVEAAVASRELAVRNLEAEQTKFANGLSTNYQVLQIQDDLARAQLTELAARITYRKALVGYFQSTGTLLESRDISIVDPAAPDVPHDYWKDVNWLQVAGPGGSEESATKSSTPAAGDAEGS